MTSFAFKRPPLSEHLAWTWRGVLPPALLIVIAAVTAALVTYAFTRSAQRDLATRMAATEAQLAQSAVRTRFLESILRRAAGDVRPLSERRDLRSEIPQASGPAASAPARPAGQQETAPAASKARQAGAPGAPMTKSTTMQADGRGNADAAPKVAVVDAAPLSPGQAFQSPLQALKAASAIAPSLPTAEQVAQARKNNPTEVVSYQQLGLQELKARQAVLRDGRIIGIGDVFPSGDRLLVIDVDGKQLITDRRTIILF